MTLQEQIRANNWRTLVVILGFAGLVGLIGAALWLSYGLTWLTVVGIVGIGYGLFSWFASGKMVARVAHAEPIAKADAPGLYRAVENASIAAGLTRTPDIYIVHDAAPNAFAAGRNPETAYVAATTGLLEQMNDSEIEGIMAHEIAHVRNRDVRLMTIAAVLVGVIALAADMMMRVTFWGGAGRSGKDNPLGIIGVVVGIIVIILAPIIAGMLQMSLSRKREYLADASAVEITGDAAGLVSALTKLGRDTKQLTTATRATAHMYIESPLRDNKGLRSSLGGLFDTHPPLQERIDRLCAASGLNPLEFQVPHLEG